MSPDNNHQPAAPKTNPPPLRRIGELFARHAETFWYALTVILPVILRKGRRPVMFSKYSGIGDILCTFPAVSKLKERHPRATFIYNCHQPYGCLPVLAGITNFVTHLRHVGVLHFWYGRLFAAFYEFPCADELPDNFCRRYVVEEYASDHAVTVAVEHPRLELSPSVRERIGKKLQGRVPPNLPLVIIQTGPTWPIREWPQTAWASLVRELQKNGAVTVVQIGTDNHLAMGAAVMPDLPGVVSLINQLTLEESCAVIAESRLFVGIDSGLLHIAAALRVPCVGIFGPTSPQLRLPANDAQHCVVSQIQCQGCHHRIPRIHWETGCPYGAACRKNIPVAEVVAACLRLLPQSQIR
jgi:ADP-heptose:LPS heptosyltransferase